MPKSFMGLDKLYYALVTDSADAYSPGTPAVLAPAAKLNIEPTTNNVIQYFDNIPMESLNAKGATKLTIEVQALSNEKLAALTGQVYDATNGMLFESGSPPPYVAIGFRGKKTDGKYRYYWFLKGNLVEPKQELETETATPTPKVTTLEFNMVRTMYQFAQSGSLTDSSKYVQADEDDAAFTGEATWFDAVKVPVVGSPSAFTCTPSPADAATGVAVSANVVLTFSNPLASGAENGIVLTSAAGVPVTVARTLNAARTEVTLNPSSNLSASTDYLVVVAGVTSIYGQALATTIYDFETA